MKIKINLEKRGHNSKPSKEASIISEQVRQAGAQIELTPQELAEKIKQGYTFTPGVIGGNHDEWKPRNAEGKREALLNPATGADFQTSDFWQQAQIIAVDIDNEHKENGKEVKNRIELTPAAALETCKAAGIDPYLIYKTFSYTPEHEKFRVLIILEEPITDFKKDYDMIGRLAYLFDAAIAKAYKAAGMEPEPCADPSIEPVKLIFGGRDDCIIYQTESITPIKAIEALPQSPAEASRSASKEKRQNNPPKYASAAEAQTEREIITDALFAINPAGLDYKEWLKVAAAAKYAGLDYDTFDRWSAQDAGTNYQGKPRYNEQANYKTWQALTDPGQNKGNRTATTGTIFYFAKNNGWSFPIKNYDAEMQKAIEEAAAEWNTAQVISPADFPADFFTEQSTQEAPAATDPSAGDANNIKSLEANMPPAIRMEKPKEQPAPAPIMSAADYYNNNLYDADIDELKKYAGRKMGLHPDIDRYLTLYPGLAIIGGQASLGKTTFLVNIAAQLLQRGEHVLYFALEQTTAEIMTKFAARYIYEQDNETETDNIKLNNGLRDPETCELLAELSEKLQNLYIIKSDFEVTVEGITATIDKFMQANGVKPIVIIDYLQIIAPPVDYRGSKTDYIDENLKALKKWQNETGLFIFLISSFNRANNYEPVSYESFLYTSAIEFTCDYVFGLQLQILDYDNEDFYIKKGKQGGEYTQMSFEKKRLVQEAQTQNPKKVQFVSLKNRKGRQLFKANFDYYPAHDYFAPDPMRTSNNPGGQNYANSILGTIKTSNEKKKTAQQMNLTDAFNTLNDDA